ncbi:MAG: GAF domain-containing protein [Burkholderiaceae bacterium]
MDVRDPDRWQGAPAAEPPNRRDQPDAPATREIKVIGPADGLETILQSFLVGVTRLVGARAGVIRSLVAGGNEMRVLAMTGLSEEAARREATAGSCGVCAVAVRRADLCVAADPATCGELSANGQFPPGSGYGTVAVPLDYKGRIVGVFTLFFNGVNELRADAIHLLRPIGQLLGVTLENAKLEHDNLNARLLHERQAMASDIHDSLAQSLTFARMRMPLLQDAIAAQDTARSLKYARDMYDELGNANRRLRGLITHFRAGLDGQGLAHALEEATYGFFERTGIALKLENRVDTLALPPSAEVQLFHVIQEALANIHRHSLARQASIIIDRLRQEIVFTIEDDGIGWDPELLERVQHDDAAHFGMEIMRDRVAGIGGRIELARTDAGGARLRIFVPPQESA